MDSEHFDVEARANIEGTPTPEQTATMIQSLLQERFKLTLHHMTRQLPVYELTLSKPGKTGSQLLPHADTTKCWDTSTPPPATTGPFPPIPCGGGVLFWNRDGVTGVAGNQTMEQFASSLSGAVDRMVLNRTGLDGNFDLTLQYTPDLGQPGASPNAPNAGAPPSLFTAIQEQLGLKLVPTTDPVDLLVVDHVEQPSEN